MPAIVDTSNLTNFCRTIAHWEPGVKFWDVMIHEVGKVLEGCVRLTIKDKWKITRSIEFKNRSLPFPGETYGRHKPVIYVNKRGLIWFYDEAGPENVGRAEGPRNKGKSKTFHPMTEFFRYGEPRWARYQAFLSDLKNKQVPVQMVLGRAAKSWVQIAESLGLSINVPGYVRNAAPFKGRHYVNGTSRRFRTFNGALLEIRNTNPVLLGTIDGAHILRTSIKGREKYFYHGISDAYIANVKETAMRYSQSFRIG